ncbi:GerAB/ArcD/ProY family transporter [Paenibacillus methanolicus]|uniref:Spore germination protein KB n=1 Tax=Paenibacillus methanolicus TaxID=582686 RepID=A0A5S5C3D3_9BACL|nr:GerAB/ArcD/ProY family transporter [Paenibacillus methanolicus]TYP73931.1 spore germination protein KB [Paenibacillus methanolicus]
MPVYITSNQAVWLLFIFLTSSAIVNLPAPLISFAGGGAWISLMAGALAGMPLLFLLLWLNRRYPGKSLIQCGQEALGLPVTMALGAAYLYYQLHIGAAVILDVAMFMRSSMMRNTESYWFIFPLFAVAAITVRTGIDKFAGLFPLLMGSVVAFTVVVAFFSTSNFDFAHMLPIIPSGIRPIIHGSIFTFGLPFAEMSLFGMLLPFIGNPDKKLGRKMSVAIAGSTICLMLSTIVALLVFGPVAGDRKYSLYEVARTVEITDVFQRIEALMAYCVIAAAFMKATIILFVAHQTCIHLLGRKEDTMLIYPLAFLMAVLSYTALHEGEAHWVYLLTTTHMVWGIVCGVGPVLLIAAVAAVRKRKKASGSQEEPEAQTSPS